jgi:phospholipid/cholesterol/gamma-HCH transport system substrate-binding protein
MERPPVPEPVKRPIVPPLVKNLELKIGLLLSFTLLLIAAFALYVLHARGAFEDTRSLVLIAENAEGINVGMPMTFSGFPIGKVKRLDLGAKGEVRIEMAIPERDARWLKQSSVFLLEKNLLGAAKIKAFSTDLGDAPLPDGETRALLTGDIAQEIPLLVERMKGILTNVQAMTAGESAINRTLGSVATVADRMAGEYGVLEGVLGGPEQARQVVGVLQKTNSLLAHLDGVSLKVDGILAKTDSQVFGPDGVMDQTRQSVAKVNAILGDARDSLRKVDVILANAQTASADVTRITGNVSAATADMARLRADVDDSLRKINHLINEINRKWPFARDVEIRTP